MPTTKSASASILVLTFAGLALACGSKSSSDTDDSDFLATAQELTVAQNVIAPGEQTPESSGAAPSVASTDSADSGPGALADAAYATCHPHLFRPERPLLRVAQLSRETISDGCGCSPLDWPARGHRDHPHVDIHGTGRKLLGSHADQERAGSVLMEASVAERKGSSNSVTS